MSIIDSMKSGRKIRYKNKHWKVGEVRRWTHNHTVNFVGSAIVIIIFSVFFCVLFSIISKYIN